MAGLRDMIQLKTITGDALTIGDVRVSSQSRVLIVRWPNGGLVWNRPVAVLVERGDETRRVPVVDATRMAQLGLMGLTILFAFLLRTLSARHKGDKNG